MTKGGSVEVKAPSETAAVDIVAMEQDSPAGRRNKKIENTDFDIVARNSLRHFTLTIMNQPATRCVNTGFDIVARNSSQRNRLQCKFLM